MILNLNLNLIFSLVITITISIAISITPSASKQLYEVNNPQLRCDVNTTSTLGYTCSSPSSSCKTFLSFRSQTSYQSPSQISSLLNSNANSISQLNRNNLSSSSNLNNDTSFPINDLILVPADCSCTPQNLYQHNSSYTIRRTGETYLLIANDTYQGLTTCQSLISQNPYNPRKLVQGDRIHAPLRCACPTKDQADTGVRYLLTYLITWGDDVLTISQRFNADLQSVLDANSLSYNQVVYPFTTLLIPLNHEPTMVQSTPPPPAPAPAVPPPPPDATGAGGKSGMKWVFVGIGVAAVVVLLACLAAWYVYCFRRAHARHVLDGTPPRKNAVDEPPSFSAEPAALSGKASSAPFMPSQIRGFIESLMVYKFSDLEKATGYFGEEYRIKGSVYRAVINGDDAAVKRLKGDISNEIGILKRINHSNVIRLSGFCMHEGDTYLVYEYAEKGSLADWLHHGKDSIESVPGWKHRVKVAYDVADGLNYLHNYVSPPYIHKNLKSSNILLDSEFRAKLANFGLARPVDEEDEAPQLTRHVVGTQGYMAPEYLEHGLITPKLDVFAFGVVMLELLSGKEAMFAKDGDEKGEVMLYTTIEKVMSGEDVREKLKDFIDSGLENDYPFDLAFAMAELAMRCVAHELGSRPAMAEVLMSLQAIYNTTLDWDPSNVGNSGSMVIER